MNMSGEKATESIRKVGSRFVIGSSVFVVGHLAPLAIPLVMASSLSTSWKTGLTGLMVFGIPEVATLIAVVVLGKEGFEILKSRIFGWASQTLFPESVSELRYYTGLVLFSMPLVVGWVYPYLQQAIPAIGNHLLIIAVSGDIVMVLGLVLMGGQAWDKIGALFKYKCVSTDSLRLDSRQSKD